MKKLLFSTAAICALGLSAGAANAQSLNYGVMQEMFGEPVTTSANGSPMRASDAPLDMTIISKEDIARYPARAIPDILRHYAGVSVRQNTSTEYSVGIRGYNTAMNERLLVLVNGRQVFEDYFGLVNWSAIPVELNEIRQIEIVRGPNTALFGFNATSGVINIVTSNPLYDDIDVVEADVGINDYKRGSAIYTWQNDDKFALRISGATSTLEEDENTVNSAVTSLRDDVYVRRVNADAALQLNDSTQMRFELSSGEVDENQKDIFDAVYARDSDNKSARMNINSDTDWGILDFTMYRNSFYSEYKGAAGTFEFDNDVTVMQISDTFKIGTSHTVRLAGEFRTNTAEMFIGGTSFGEETLNIGSLSTLWYWNISDSLSTSAAVRYDHVATDFDPSVVGLGASPFSREQYQNKYDEFGYNLGAVYKMTDYDTFRLTAAKGVDLPSTWELSTVIPATASLYGDPTTEVSEVYDYQLGYERQLDSINGKFKLGAFYQYIEEMQETRIITFPTLSYYDNIGDSEVFGVEVGLEGITDGGIRWGASYSYSEIDDDFIDATGADFESEHSEHMVKVNLGYSPSEEWAIDVFAAYESDFDSSIDTSATTTDVVGIDPDVIVDAKITYVPSYWEGVTFSLNGQALLGENEQSATGEDVDSQIFLRAKYEF